MRHRSKRYQQAIQLYNPSQLHSLKEALKILMSFPKVRFDETVDVVFRLGINPSRSDEQVRGFIVLPHPFHSQVRVLVFADGQHAQEASKAGADYVGLDEYIEKISSEKWLAFDAVIATPNVMGKVGKVAKILGPRRLMPNPRFQTVTFEVAKAVQDAKNGKVIFQNDKAGNLQVSIGKRSMEVDAIAENFETLVDTVIRLKPPSSKGVYLREIYLSSTMSPGIALDPSPFR
jgi:large subunit ribosomal protein L1